MSESVRDSCPGNLIGIFELMSKLSQIKETHQFFRNDEGMSSIMLDTNLIVLDTSLIMLDTSIIILDT